MCYFTVLTNHAAAPRLHVSYCTTNLMEGSSAKRAKVKLGDDWAFMETLETQVRAAIASCEVIDGAPTLAT